MMAMQPDATMAEDLWIVHRDTLNLFAQPADFLRSLHLQFVQVYLETEKDFGKALSLEQLRREKQVGFDSFWPQATQRRDGTNEKPQ